MLSQPGASRFRVSITPGSSLSKPAGSRPLRAMSSIVSRVISPERAPLVVCTCTDSDCTVIVSVMPPTSSAIGRRPHPVGRAEGDGLLLVALEPLHGDGQVERARQQVGKQKRAIGAGHGLPRQASARSS